MGTHPIFESDFDCLTGMSSIVEPLLEHHTLPRIFSSSTCAVCLYFNEQHESIFSCDHCNPDRKLFFCQKHCHLVPEHQKTNKNYHEVNDIYKRHRKEEFAIKTNRTCDGFMTKLKDETAQLEREKREALETTDSYFESMIEQFRTELECHRRMMHGEARERLAGRLAQIDEEIKNVDEALESESDAQYKAALERRQLKVGPFLTMTMKPLVGAENLLGVSVKGDSTNKYWRCPSAIQIYRYKPAQLPQWCMRDWPMLQLPHPDQKQNVEFASQLSAKLRQACRDETPVDQVDKIMIMKRGDTYCRVVKRQLSKDMVLAISYEPGDLPVDMVIKFLGDITKSKVNYFYTKNQHNAIVNSMLYYPGSRREYDLVREKLADSRYWARGGVKKVSCRTRSTTMLSFMDYPHAPVLLDVNESETELPILFKCPAEYTDWSTYPAMYLEIWLDNSHPGKKGFYDPFQKQLIMPDSSHPIRQRLTMGVDEPIKVEFIRQLQPTQMPHLWLGLVTHGGEGLNGALDNIFVKRTTMPLPI